MFRNLSTKYNRMPDMEKKNLKNFLRNVYSQFQKLGVTIKVRGVVFLLILSLVALISLLTIRGLSGNPSLEELKTVDWQFNGPLELSPERGRFALVYSIAEEHSLIFSLPVAKLAIPDLAMNAAGEYVSLFAPAVSFLAVPGYLLGKLYGAAQIGAFAVISIFALLNFVLIRSIAFRLGAEPWAALLGALTFSLATPALPYAGTLYQHHVTVFLLLFAVWILVSFRNIWSLAFVWFACVLSVVVDNPNLFLMFPVGLLALMRLRELIAAGKGVSKRVTRGIFGLLTFVTVIIPLGFFVWYNQAAYHNPFQLPGTLRSVTEIGPDGKPAKENSYEKQVLTEEQLRSLREGKTQEKTAVGFFETRNLYNGFYIHFISPDRSLFWFTPVILLGLIGLALLYRRERQITALIVACIGANILLYSMWGDPWGGWAFGSRYLIPTYALLTIGIAFTLSRWRYSLVTLFLFIPLFIFSLWVNTLGAVTSLANPPEVQVLSLEKQSGHEQKYTFMRNWEFLNGKYEPTIGSKAFVYQIWGKKIMTARAYHGAVFGLGLAALFLVLLTEFFPWRKVDKLIKPRRV